MGSPRVTAELRSRGRHVDVKRVARLMKGTPHRRDPPPDAPSAPPPQQAHKPKLPDLAEPPDRSSRSAPQTALVFGHFANPWAWTYFAFIVAFFVSRQRDDDKLCAEKYGAGKWAEYKARVRYRIIPGLY